MDGTETPAERRARYVAFVHDLQERCVHLGMPRRWAQSLQVERLLCWWMQADSMRMGATPEEVMAVDDEGLRALHQQLSEERESERLEIAWLQRQAPESNRAA